VKAKKSLLLSAAVSGLMLTGCPEGGKTNPAPAPAPAPAGTATPAAGDKHVCKGKAADGKNDCASAEYKHTCKGANACKGQGGCKSGDAGCAGKNTCKTKGGCNVPVKQM